jgi:diadenosine tetraphosphate (Ap4A) HIT family hydrolase
MPDLHCFIIPRYNDDPRWRGPAWTTTRADMASYDLPEQDRASRLLDLRSAVAQAKSA